MSRDFFKSKLFVNNLGGDVSVSWSETETPPPLVYIRMMGMDAASGTMAEIA